MLAAFPFTFISPVAGLVAAAIAVPLLVALYFLKLRRKQVVVSTTLLWKKTIQDMQVNAPFQKLRKSLLLLLQLIILAALLFAFARPARQDIAKAGQRTILIIDRSASMRATDVAPFRLADAKLRAIKQIDDIATNGGAAMVVSFGQGAQVLQTFTTDHSLLVEAVDKIYPTDELSHIDSALRLVEPFARDAANAPAGSLVVSIFSDGQVQDASPTSLKGVDLQYHRIGKKNIGGDGPDNLAIVSLAARRDFKKPERVQVFARLANYSTKQIDTQVALRVGGVSQRVVPASVGPVADGAAGTGEPGVQSVQFDLEIVGAALLEVVHDHEDNLASDNSAALSLAPPRRLRVLLVSEGNAFIEQAIKASGVRKLAQMTPKRFEDQDPQRLSRFGWAGSSDAEGFDVIIFDQYTPKAAPLVDSLYFGSVPPVEGLKLVKASGSATKAQAIIDWQRDHPLMRYVALDDVILSEPGRIVLPDQGEIFATSQAGPVIAGVNVNGVHHVVASFEVLKTNWPMQISFPVFVSNAIAWLGLGGQTDAGSSFQTGQVAVVPAGKAKEEVRYDGAYPLKANIAQGRAVLPMFERVGVYKALNQGIEQPWDQIAVNLADATESDLRSVEKLTVGTIAAAAQNEAAAVRREIWPWFAWAALAVLMVEWLVYTRRMHL